MSANLNPIQAVPWVGFSLTSTVRVCNIINETRPVAARNRYLSIEKKHPMANGPGQRDPHPSKPAFRLLSTQNTIKPTGHKVIRYRDARCAKRTQFPMRQNGLNLFSYNLLRGLLPEVSEPKRTQFATPMRVQRPGRATVGLCRTDAICARMPDEPPERLVRSQQPRFRQDAEGEISRERR